jgi:hypothetical protein
MVFRRFWRWCFRSKLERTGPASTFVRLLTSEHVKDLQLIGECAIAFWLIAVSATIVNGIGLRLVWEEHDHDLHAILAMIIPNLETIWTKFITKVIQDHAILGAVTAGAGLVLNWVYQTGSKRLGVVDLFACEISALCRASFVVDFATLSVGQATADHKTSDAAVSLHSQPTDAATSQARRFTSEEHYTPVYDGTLSDLQPLDVTVVTFVTEFYTYRKAMMDYLRSITAEAPGERQTALRTMMIYMQFLMYESGRHAIGKLIEFEPNREESLINILCSELIVFNYLNKNEQLKNDYRGPRLRLREDEYRWVVPTTYYKTLDAAQTIKPGTTENWVRALSVVPELKRRFELVIGTMPSREELRAQKFAAMSPQHPPQIEITA